MHAAGAFLILSALAALSMLTASGRMPRSARRFAGSLGRNAALTLIEVLLVIVIVIVATLLMLPWRGDSTPRRRAGCLNNLCQIGLGLEMYCSGNGGYFPCWPGYGSRPEGNAPVQYQAAIGALNYTCRMNDLMTGATVGNDEPVRVPPLGKVSNSVSGNCAADFPGTSFFRTCFIGAWTAPGAGAQGATCFTGPVGLGYLVTGGYLRAMGNLQCPDAKQMPWDAGAMYAATSPSDIQTLKGNTGLTDMDVMPLGDWPGLAGKLGGNWQSGRAGGNPVYGCQSDYNYRGVPISACGDAGITSADFTGTTSPGITAYVGCPQFETQKELQDRALVCDTFSNFDPPGGAARQSYNLTQAMLQGYGRWAHKNGYNVLYGDGHVAWFGDPSYKIMNWSSSNTTALPDDPSISPSIASIADMSGGTPTASTPNGKTQPLPSLGFHIWHFFDTNAGIDLTGH